MFSRNDPSSIYGFENDYVLRSRARIDSTDLQRSWFV